MIAAASAVPGGVFGMGTGPILLDELMCTGTENGLLSCPFTTMHDCTHAEDAGVRCQGARKYHIENYDPMTIRLATTFLLCS